MLFMRDGRFVKSYVPKGFKKKDVDLVDDLGFSADISGFVEDENCIKTLSDYDLACALQINDGFPYPQLLDFGTHQLLCGVQKIYEISNGVANLLIDIGIGNLGDLWTGFSSFDFVYLSNNKVSVKIDPISKDINLNDELISSAMINYNGQILAAFKGI